MTYQQKIRKLYGLDDTIKFGFAETRILDLEKQLNFIFPKILREYYLTLGENESINNAFNRLLRPNDEIDFTSDRYLVFYEENQAVVCWGMKEQDLRFDNPCVYGNYGASNLTQEWFVDSLTIEDFLLSMAFWNGVLGGLEFNANTSTASDLTEATIEKIETGWTELKGITNQYLRFFTNDFSEVIIFTTDLESTINGLYIGSNDKEKYRSIIDTLRIEWDYRADRDG